MTQQEGALGTMAFYHPDGLVPAFQQASKFAGEEGRIATLPEIIEARMASELHSSAWCQYFTTLSAEYVGLSREGKPIVVVAHGVGPMATLEGIVQAYSHEFKDKDRRKNGGRIPQDIFLRLADGEFGEVTVVDLEEVWARREYNFSGHAITRKEIEQESLWQARLGPRWLEYIRRHEEIVDVYHEEQGTDSPYMMHCVIAMDGASNCSYSTRKMFKHWMKETPDTAICHLLSIGGVIGTSHHQYWDDDYGNIEFRSSNLVSDVDCHEWWNGVRFAALRNEEVGVIHPGVGSMRGLMAANWQRLMQVHDNPLRADGFFCLMELGDQTFTQYPKAGERMDTYDPEFRVVSTAPVADDTPHLLRTHIGGYHGFFKYGIKEVQRIAPTGANAYRIKGDPTFEGDAGDPTHHLALIEFFRVEIDVSEQMMLDKDIWRDYDLLMELLGNQSEND